MGGARGAGSERDERVGGVRAVAVEPAFDAVHAWGDAQAVRSAGFRFEATFSQGWPGWRSIAAAAGRSPADGPRSCQLRPAAVGSAASKQGGTVTQSSDLAALSGAATWRTWPATSTPSSR